VSPKQNNWKRNLAKLGFFSALKFLTIFPAPKRWGKTIEELGQSLSYFPLIGLILGAMLLGLDYGLSLILPDAVVNVLLIITLVIMTGAHHLDGLMDSFDGTVSGKSRDRRLEIMADSHVGTFGIIAAILLLLLKYASLSSVPANVIMPALLLMPTLGRWIVVNTIFIFPSAKSSGMGFVFKKGATWQRLTIATIIALAASVLLLRWHGAVLMAALWLITFGIASYFRSRLGGLTGDVYGAINELSEVLVLILVIILYWSL
jgi:adenosylcobinamide-GDP ribazoletransferase